LWFFLNAFLFTLLDLAAGRIMCFLASPTAVKPQAKVKAKAMVRNLIDFNYPAAPGQPQVIRGKRSALTPVSVRRSGVVPAADASH